MNSNWSEQQKAKTEVKEQNKVRREKLVGYFFNLSQLTFAGLVLGGLSPLITDNIEKISIVPIIFGTFAIYFFAFFANRILKQ